MLKGIRKFICKWLLGHVWSHKHVLCGRPEQRCCYPDYILSQKMYYKDKKMRMDDICYECRWGVRKCKIRGHRETISLIPKYRKE